MNTEDVLTGIFERELERLNKISQTTGLDSDAIKDLEGLTRAYKNFKAPEKKSENPLDGLSTDELLEFIKGDSDGRGKAKS